MARPASPWQLQGKDDQTASSDHQHVDQGLIAKAPQMARGFPGDSVPLWLSLTFRHPQDQPRHHLEKLLAPPPSRAIKSHRSRIQDQEKNIRRTVEPPGAEAGG